MLFPDFEYFYFIRHGRTDANDLGLMAGGTNDLPINPTGQDQAKKASIIIESKCSEIQTICTSTMLRARQTTEIILNRTPRNLVVDENLVEWKFGAWEGRHWDDVGSLFLDNESSPEYGESRIDFKNRVLIGLKNSLMQKPPILIVAHGGVWFMLQKILNLPIIKTDNCQIFKIYKDESFFFKSREIIL